MKVKYSLLTKQDINKMRENVERDGEFCPNKLEEFINQPNTYGFIAKLNNEIIGFAYCYKLKHPHVGEDGFFLYSIDILERHQNKGAGSGLIEFIKSYAWKLGCGEVFVMADKGNPRACHVYEKCGGKNDYEDEVCYVIYNKSGGNHDKL